MRIRARYIWLLLFLCAVGATVWKVAQSRNAFVSASASYAATWDPKAATRYLDNREVWWQNWQLSQMDRGTICVSCHTVVPYALVRPTLRHELDENKVTPSEQVMLASIGKRVTDWSEMTPFYTDAIDGPGKAEQSHATEAVLNAVILSSYDAAEDHLSPLARLAYGEAWALQERAGENAGGWNWQDFHQAPWESRESAYQGAALMAVALGDAPDGYAGENEVRENLELLKQYLRRGYDAQPLMSKLYVLWASARISGLLTDADRANLADQVADLQLSDGGWALSSLDEQSRKHAYLDKWRRFLRTGKSDGCATGLVVLAIETAGVKQHEAMRYEGLEWLERHQKKDGSWWASSLNGQKDPDSDIGRFMSDAATGYAMLALERAAQNGSRLARQGTDLRASGTSSNPK
jgi:squalene-hopene/tetraprenyl-beta-curcumene cyclase